MGAHATFESNSDDEEETEEDKLCDETDDDEFLTKRQCASI